MVAEVFAGPAAFKNMFDMASGLQKIYDTVARDRAVLDLQREILAAQAQQMSLIETIGQLKKQLAEFETWEREKLRYDLVRPGYSAFVYQLKPDERGDIPPHWACSNCFEHKHIAIIQRVHHQVKGLVWQCPACKNPIGGIWCGCSRTGADLAAEDFAILALHRRVRPIFRSFPSRIAVSISPRRLASELRTASL
jgi:hypothetical protein